jgi:dTDP-4-amino-4,6-dideoxygalactose transaminase
MKVPLIDLVRQNGPIKKELLKAFESALDSGQFVLGKEVKEFEEEIASYSGVKYGIGVSNCTNALLLSLKALGIGDGDEVIIPVFTFIATAEVIVRLGGKPVFCDIEPRTFNIDPERILKLITEKTKAVIPVHLYGQSADMDEITTIAKEKKIRVIEDMAQAIGAKYRGNRVGGFGDIACISFFPTKNLNALGDGGMILTNEESLAEDLRILRDHGATKKYRHDIVGYNERLDAIQASFLRIKLKSLDKNNERRREIAKRYSDGLENTVEIPYVRPENESVFHQYTIRTPKRDELRNHLTERGIGSAIHYPLPLHFQKAFSSLGYREGDFPEAEKASKEVLSLPIQSILTDGEVDYVIESIKEFFSR